METKVYKIHVGYGVLRINTVNLFEDCPYRSYQIEDKTINYMNRVLRIKIDIYNILHRS